MSGNNEKTRVFFAFEIPDNLQNWIKNNVIDVLSRLPVKVKWIERKNIHITLRFIGEIGRSKIDEIVSNVGKNIGGIGEIELKLARIGYFGGHTPKVIWIGLNGDINRLDKIHERIELACRNAGIKPNDRKFSPHITIGRVKSPLHTGKLIENMKNIVIPDLSLRNDELVLFKSTLTPTGPIYEVMKRFKF